MSPSVWIDYTGSGLATQAYVVTKEQYRALYSCLTGKMFCSRKNSPKSISDTVSVDLGIKNLAWVHIDRNLVIKDWRLTELGEVKPYRPSQLYQLVVGFAADLPSADSIVLELQYHRPRQLGVGMNLRCLEAMLYGYLGHHYPIFSLSSKAVQSQFSLLKGRGKKKQSTNLVMDMLNGQSMGEGLYETLEQRKLVVPERLSAMFKNAKKQDDLADCLLQALTFFELIDKHDTY